MIAGSGSLLAAEFDAQAVEAKLRSIAPGAGSIALSDTPIEGLLQAQVNNDIVYVSSDGDYLFQGTMYDIATRTNLTDQAKSVIRMDVLKNMDTEGQIVFAPENPKYELTVFTDIDCGYCRKLHEQMAEYNAEGIAIRYMAFPRAGVGSHSYEKYVSVWCSDDQQEALTLAKSGSEPEPMQCENPIESQYAIGRDIGISGTPALLTQDGTLIPGYMTPADLLAKLQSIESQVAQAQ
jgi:thiol:disulfide interchange protein DsbC